ncbi:MAG TPA: zinc-dependent metalloprotease [Thermoanaerobaculia bacterium]|nr:zinc-dependent metalloprotease [Thermoanaerobaculia bacterium]
MKRLLTLLFVAMIGAGCASTSPAEAPSASPADPIAAQTAELQKLDGFIPLYWDADKGRLLMEISRWNEEILYQVSLPAGLGSNPIGLDRNQLGGTHVVLFERIGPKVLMVHPNYRYRAITGEATEQKSVEESFARSVLWGFTVETAVGERVLVDATSFFLQDARNVIPILKRAGQGTFTLDPSRSAFYLPRTMGFPKNTEVETMLTFTSADPGSLVRSVAPVPETVTLRQHHSFVELPGPGYTPRRFDPRVGVFGIEFHDFASPIHEPIVKRWISRHRLIKRDSTAAVSEPVEPIVYYLDPGTPEPIRSALLEGASWWAEAFAAAGFRNAYRVEMLPPDADPMDVRYNLISWVHRSTRGWSYGDAVVDPRTGEIIKGNVSLGSLRVRQDYLLATGMIPLFEETPVADATYLASLDPSINPLEMSLARIRQLSAHEVGHTLGLAHNFAASTYGRASVMDYPAPWVRIIDGKLDLSQAYGRGIGAYDAFAIRYAYAQFPPGADEASELDKIVREGIAAGMLFITDQDARPAGAAHPLANLWDNGDDPIAMLRHELEVRRIAMEQFGLGNIPAGTPLSQLEAQFLPLYLHHRYQLEAAVKSLGGFHYTYSVRAPEGPIPSEWKSIVSPSVQRAALAAVLDTLEPDTLRIPLRILDLIPPPAYGYQGGTIELFEKRTDPGFDPIGAATIAADIAIRGVLEPHRAARLIEYHALDAANPGFDEVAGELIARTWEASRSDPYDATIERAVESLVLTRMMELAANASASAQVRAIATDTLRDLQTRLRRSSSADPVERAHQKTTVDDIERFLTRPAAPFEPTEALPIPAGSPIGG